MSHVKIIHTLRSCAIDCSPPWTTPLCWWKWFHQKRRTIMWLFFTLSSRNKDTVAPQTSFHFHIHHTCSLQEFSCFLNSTSEESQTDHHNIEYRWWGVRACASVCVCVGLVVMRLFCTDKKKTACSHFTVFQVYFFAKGNTFENIWYLEKVAHG